MAEQGNKQYDRRGGNRVGRNKPKCSTNLPNCENDESKVVILNSDCMEHVFQYLPLIDLFRVQRVCKYWRMISLEVCRRITRLDVTRKQWGITCKGNIELDFSILAKVLRICGPNLRHIGLSHEETDCIYEKRKIHVESKKNVWIMIRESCPSITSLDFGESRSTATLKFVSYAFTNLVYFKMTKFTLPGKSGLVHEPHISELFANNKKLKAVELFELPLTTECLTKLNPANLQELNLSKCRINDEEILANALKELKKLKKLTLSDCLSQYNIWINLVLEALGSISDSLRYLDFYLYNTRKEVVNPAYFGKLNKLEVLHVAGDCVIDDTVLTVITDCCKELKELKIHNTADVTDLNFEKLAELPKLKTVILEELPNVTDDILHSMTSMVNLKVTRCIQFQNNGFSNLIRNSTNLRSLQIIYCENINGPPLIEVAEQCLNDYLELVVDCSYTDGYYDCIYKLSKIHGNIEKTLDRFCVGCFSARRQSCDACGKTVEFNS